MNGASVSIAEREEQQDQKSAAPDKNQTTTPAEAQQYGNLEKYPKAERGGHATLASFHFQSPKSQEGGPPPQFKSCGGGRGTQHQHAANETPHAVSFSVSSLQRHGGELGCLSAVCPKRRWFSACKKQKWLRKRKPAFPRTGRCRGGPRSRKHTPCECGSLNRYRCDGNTVWGNTDHCMRTPSHPQKMEAMFTSHHGHLRSGPLHLPQLGQSSTAEKPEIHRLLLSAVEDRLS